MSRVGRPCCRQGCCHADRYRGRDVSHHGCDHGDGRNRSLTGDDHVDGVHLGRDSFLCAHPRHGACR